MAKTGTHSFTSWHIAKVLSLALCKAGFGHMAEFQPRPGDTLNQAPQLHSLYESSQFTYETHVNHMLKMGNLSLPKIK